MKGPARTTSIEVLSASIGKEIGTSEWFLIDQPMIDAFARLTQDEYFIHVDPAAAAATQFKSTIAHGFLSLSMLSVMAYQACPAVEGSKTQVNYGFNRLRFVSPVPVNARIRGRFTLKAFDVQPGERWQATHDVTVEIENKPKPALVAEWLSAGFF